MWNLNYANRKCNEQEKEREHFQHLERITNIKGSLDIKKPKKPSFLIYKTNKNTNELSKNLFYKYNLSKLEKN